MRFADSTLMLWIHRALNTEASYRCAVNFYGRSLLCPLWSSTSCGGCYGLQRWCFEADCLQKVGQQQNVDAGQVGKVGAHKQVAVRADAHVHKTHQEW